MIVACSLAAGAMPARAAEPPYPRLANMYLQGGIDAADIPALARWDVLILDATWTRSNLQTLRALNPNIKLFYYVCASARRTAAVMSSRTCMTAEPPEGWCFRKYSTPRMMTVSGFFTSWATPAARRAMDSICATSTS